MFDSIELAGDVKKMLVVGSQLLVVIGPNVTSYGYRDQGHLQVFDLKRGLMLNPDRNGVDVMVELAVGRSSKSARSGTELPLLEPVWNEGGLKVRFQRSLNAADYFDYHVQTSADLTSWSDAKAEVIGTRKPLIATTPTHENFEASVDGATA
ncbi:MAG: hypothetical protein AAF591_22595 [Verrucomicrobiota bacterium]